MVGLGLASPACCCTGQPNPPAPGPPGVISGAILFPPRSEPSSLAVYAINTDRYAALDMRYVMTRVTAPARTYQMSVPPGDYVVTARLDANPLSAAGYLTCPAGRNCEQVMSRAGYVMCQTIDCQPVLAAVQVLAGQGVPHIDIGDWGSLYALQKLWQLDEYGAPGPFEAVTASGARVTPAPAPGLPIRGLPPPSSGRLPSEFDLARWDNPGHVAIRLHLPAGWHAVPNPTQKVEQYGGVYDFTDQAVRSPLSLSGDGLWLLVSATYDACPVMTTPGGTARAFFGEATLYFEDPHSPLGAQPFSGFAVVGVMPAVRGCVLFRLTALSDQSRESNLASLLAVMQQAQYVS